MNRITKLSDEAHAQLKALGWSCGDVAFYRDSRKMWQVYAHRGEQNVIVEAKTQGEAWIEAARMAEGKSSNAGSAYASCPRGKFLSKSPFQNCRNALLNGSFSPRYVLFSLNCGFALLPQTQFPYILGLQLR